MKRPKIVLAFVFGFLIAFRCLVDKFDNLVVVVAMINIIALFVVIFDSAEELKIQIQRKIISGCASKQIALREKKKFTVLFYSILSSLCVVFVILYFTSWCSYLGNDIISIVALAISILSQDIIALVTNLYRM